VPAIDGPENVDLLLTIDNSSSMGDGQLALTRDLGGFIDALVNPPFDPATMRPRFTPVKSLNVGVISSDLGTPGSVVASCANSDQGDDGLLNPVRNGAAMRQHQPWTTAPAGRRPARCTNDPNQYPSFLRFDRMTSDVETFREELVCNAYLSVGGCGLEQPLEAAYRALVVHNPRAAAGNTDPNAGFVRDNAMLALVMVTDEEDGSTRDCRYAERGVPCADAVSVFDQTSTQWSSPDLNLRFYNYVPGSAQDPTWPIDRYIDPRNPGRGFTSLKPGRPERVIFAGIAGVPVDLPMRTADGETTVDWTTLLGARADGADGFVGSTPEGPVSMRQRNVDPACPTRVVPACRRGAPPPGAPCQPAPSYLALPSRRVAEVARRFDERYHNGTVASICQPDLRGALSQIALRIQRRIGGSCIGSVLPTVPAPCEPGSGQQGCELTRCVVREVLPEGVSAASACTAISGRTRGERDPLARRDTCVVRQVALPPGGSAPAGAVGFYYSARFDPADAGCERRVSFTPGLLPYPGATIYIECPTESAVDAGPVALICR